MMISLAPVGANDWIGARWHKRKYMSTRWRNKEMLSARWREQSYAPAGANDNMMSTRRHNKEI
jgi:hypothetical protein